VSFLQSIYPGDSLASFLIRVLAEITLVTSVALVFGRVAVRNNPALRHGVCVCALLCVLVAPITTFGLQRMGWRTLQISLESENSVSLLNSTENTDRPLQIRTRTEHGFWTLERAREAASATILIWLAGTGYLVFRLMGGMKRVTRIRNSSYDIDHPKLRQALELLSAKEKLPAAPIRFSQRLNGPVVVGPRRTTVVLPVKLLEQLSVDQLRCVLAHELTHVRQRDPLIGLVQRIVEAGYWPHPFVHLLNRDLIRAREEVCDNVALNGTTAPQYADTLLTVALGIAPRRAATPGAVGLMAPPWKLEERVKGLLDPHRRLTTTMNTRHLAFMAIALASGIALIAGARIVAAPNPPTLQQVVELHSSYNVKTHKIDVTSKSHRLSAIKSKRVVRLISKPSRKATSEVSYYAVQPTRVYALKSNDAVYLKTVPVQTQRITVSPKVANPAVNVYSVESAYANTPFILQGTTDIVKADPTISRVYVTGTSGNLTLKSVEADKVGAATITQAGDIKSGTTADVITQVKSADTPALTTQVTLADPNNASASVQVYNLKSVQGNQPQVQYYTVTPKDVKSATIQVTPWPNGSDVYFRQDGKTKAEWSSKDVFKENPFKFQPEKVYRIRYAPSDANIWATPAAAKRKQTTIYITGGDIKIVGDDIKVVYLKPDPPKPKGTDKSGKSKPKSK